jgi:hypothetical protein
MEPRIRRAEVSRIRAQILNVRHERDRARHVRERDGARRGRHYGEEAEPTAEGERGLSPVAGGEGRGDGEHAVVRRRCVGEG